MKTGTQHNTTQPQHINKIHSWEDNEMKRTVTYNRAVQQLAKIGKAINEFYFDNELPPVTITVQSSSRAHGWCTMSPVWTNADGEHTYEINVSAET